MADIKRTNLTTGKIHNAKCELGKAQSFIWDSGAPGLALRITPSGYKAFIFEGRINGKTIRMTIGDVRTWLLDGNAETSARSEARRLQALIDQGIDPRDILKKREEAKAAEKAAEEAARIKEEEKRKFTLRALCDAYCDYLQQNGKTKSAAETRSAFKCHVFNEPNKKVANSPANEITALQVAALVRAVHEAGKIRTAGILRSYLNAAFNAAKRAPFDSTLPSSLIAFNVEHNPVDAIPAIAVKAGNRVLSSDELKLYLSHLGEDLADKALLLALLAGGQRMAQLLRVKIGDFDPESNILRIWDGKGKRMEPREHLLPLGPKAAELVKDLIRIIKTREGKDGISLPTELQDRWLFSSHGRVAMTFTTPGKRVAEISGKIGGEAFDLRDIRRTCETMLAKLGISKDLRAQLLSHGLSGVQDTHYDRHDYLEEKHRALLAWEAHITCIWPGIAQQAISAEGSSMADGFSRRSKERAKIN